MTDDAIISAMLATLDRHSHALDLDRDDLGKRLCKVSTDGAQRCIADECTPEGQPWVPLSEAYEEWKSFQFPGNPMGVLYQHMANPREVAGKVQVTTNQAVVTYGVSDQAKQEATWFQEGSGRPGHGQPPRPFWGFTDESLKEIERIMDQRFRSA